MRIFSLLAYVFSLLAGVTCMVISIQLFSKYRVKYLSYLVFYTLSCFITGFLNLMGRNLVEIFCIQQPQLVKMLGNYVMVLLILPFLGLTLYFFMAFMSEIAEKTISYFYSVWFFLIWLGIFITILVGIKIMVDTGKNVFLQEIFRYIDIGIMIFFLLVVFKLQLDVRWMSNPDKRNGLRMLGILYLPMLGSYFGFVQQRFTNFFGSVTFDIIVFFYFFLNIPPLLYLKHFLKKLYTTDSLLPEDLVHMGEFFITYKISNQEREIIKLVMLGKDNQFIAQKLSITYGTVKNHLYNIYRRLGINSRFELVQKVRHFVHNMK